MILQRTNELGIISVSNNVFAQIVADSFGLVIGKAWPGTKKGKQIGNDIKFNLSELESTLQVTEIDDELYIKFYIIVKFGASIKNITDELMKYCFENIAKVYGKRPTEIVICVSGIKSRQIAKRDIEVARRDEDYR